MALRTLPSGCDGGSIVRDDTDLPANMVTLINKGQTALTDNAAFLALAAPTNAQAVAQVQALTRQVNALIRLQIGQLDSTAGT